MVSINPICTRRLIVVTASSPYIPTHLPPLCSALRTRDALLALGEDDLAQLLGVSQRLVEACDAVDLRADAAAEGGGGRGGGSAADLGTSNRGRMRDGNYSIK